MSSLEIMDPRVPDPTVREARPRRLLLARARSHRGLLLGSVVLVAALLLALLAPAISPHDPYHQDLAQRMKKPVWYAAGTWEHPLGTDNLGRDYLSRMIYGSRISLLIGFSAMAISGLIGATLGILGGYLGGKADLALSFVTTLRLSLPVVLVALAVVAMVGGSLIVVVSVIGLLQWDRFAIVMRSATQQVRNLDYVDAARALGSSTPRILFKTVLPNVAHILIVVATVDMANAILLEAALSFLGLGVQPPLPSWGLMVSEGKNFMFFDAWLITIPGFAIGLLVLAINLLGDGIRDVTQPGRHD